MRIGYPLKKVTIGGKPLELLALPLIFQHFRRLARPGRDGGERAVPSEDLQRGATGS